MRALRRLLAVTALGFGLLVVTGGGASAHPIGNFTINTYDRVLVVPGEVRVTFVLDMAEIPTFQLSHAPDADGDGDATEAELAAFARTRSARLVEEIDVRVDGRRVGLEVRSASAELRPGQAGLRTLRLEAVFAGPTGRSGSVAFADHTYADRVGWHEVTAVGARGAAVTGSDVPTTSVSRELLRYPTDLLSNPLDVTTARFSFRPGASDAAPAARDGGGDGSRPGVSGGAFAGLATWTGLSIPALVLALVLAAAFGAGHALLPGHGKTLMAAYLVGQGGRVKQAAQVGVAVAVMHSASVLALGLAILGLEVVAPDRIYPWITLATGLVVLGMGVALVVLRAREARNGRQHGHGHAHSHDAGRRHTAAPVRLEARERVPALALVGVPAGPALVRPAGDGQGSFHHDEGDLGPTHGHDHPHAGRNGPDLERPLSRRGLAGLAAAGGILPSPTAIVVLLATFSAHRAAFGLALILSFSAGMAAALVGVGIVALRVRRALARRLSGRVLWALPVLTALVIVGVGLFLAVNGATSL